MIVEPPLNATQPFADSPVWYLIKNMSERTWRNGLEAIGAKVIAHCPKAAEHLPTHMLSLAVMKRERVIPALHLIVDDKALRDEAIYALDKLEEQTGIHIGRERGRDSVLVVCSAI